MQCMVFLDLSPISLIICGFFIFLAGLAKGFSGFGQSAIIVAGLTLFLPATIVVPAALFIEISTSLGQLPSVYRLINMRMLSILLVSALFGNLMGIQLLTSIDDTTVRIAIAAIIGFCVITLLSGFRYPYKLPQWAFAGVGLISGITNGLAALGGLPVVLAFAITQTPPATFRANLIAYFMALEITAIIMAWQHGLVQKPQMLVAAYALPIVFLGIWIGSIGFHRINVAHFQRIVLILLLTIATILLVRTLAI